LNKHDMKGRLLLLATGILCFFRMGLACCLYVAIAGPAAASKYSAGFPNFVTEKAFSTEGMHIIGVESDKDQELRWATWGKRSKHGPSIVLALLKKTKKGVSVLWSIEKLDGYEPAIKRIPSWRYGRHPVLALTFQYGALAAQVELYGLDEKERPTPIVEKLGESIEWSVSSHGEELMNIYSNSADQIIQHCYRWEKIRQRLEQVKCR